MVTLTTTITASASLMSGCQDDQSYKWYKRQNALVCINANVNREENAPTKQYVAPLSKVEVIAQADEIWFYNRKINPVKPMSRPFSAHQRDTTAMRLWLYGDEVIGPGGGFVSDFVEAESVVLTRTLPNLRRDTIAYIPNSTMRTNRDYLKAAYEKGNYADIYLILEEAYVFFPITAQEWRFADE